MPYLIQRVLGLAGLLVLGPLILVLGLAVRMTSSGPAFHRATRARPGGTFTLYKLRTMAASTADSGPAVTASGDPRVTKLGRTLRRTKLDELPQLWNVVRGEMALVGPRPEDPHFVDLSDPLHARVFAARPGITGPTALAFRDEEVRLERASQARARSAGRKAPTTQDVEFVYREEILPEKLRIDSEYLSRRSAMYDVQVLLATLGLDIGSTGLATEVELDEFIEWGGSAWRGLVAQAVQQMGDLHGKRVLEIGTRSGRMATYFALAGAEVVGVDVADGIRTGGAELRRE